ncbi:MAG TPA: DUF262 domain-containing protein, partial [Caulobacteraceae bacterium]
MATPNVVNLDALLPREDLDAPAVVADDLTDLKVNDLDQGLVYGWLRKPDFQRETANWAPEKVAHLIETFVRGEIIPSIILWQSGQRVFVIDGAHRLSALIAWIKDDYGAGGISAAKFENYIPSIQRDLDRRTRSLVDKSVGSYSKYKIAAQHPGNADQEFITRVTRVATRSLPVQWIMNASVDQARDAFFRINEGGVRIDPTEIRILKARSSGVAIAARAITRSGKGHNYWSKFDAPVQKKIEEYGQEIGKLLFEPPLVTPIKTIEVPLAGYGYGAHVL